jgi:hypothetical protein
MEEGACLSGNVQALISNIQVRSRTTHGRTVEAIQYCHKTCLQRLLWQIGFVFTNCLTAVDPAFSGEAQGDHLGFVERRLRQIGFVFSNGLLSVIFSLTAILRLPVREH